MSHANKKTLWYYQIVDLDCNYGWETYPLERKFFDPNHKKIDFSKINVSLIPEGHTDSSYVYYLPEDVEQASDSSNSEAVPLSKPLKFQKFESRDALVDYIDDNKEKIVNYYYTDGNSQYIWSLEQNPKEELYLNNRTSSESTKLDSHIPNIDSSIPVSQKKNIRYVYWIHSTNEEGDVLLTEFMKFESIDSLNAYITEYHKKDFQICGYVDLNICGCAIS